MSPQVSAAKKSSLPWQASKTLEFRQSVQPSIPTAVLGFTSISPGWWLSHILPKSWLKSALSSLKTPINSKKIYTKICCVEVLCQPYELWKGPTITLHPVNHKLVLLQHLVFSIKPSKGSVDRLDLGYPRGSWEDMASVPFSRSYNQIIQQNSKLLKTSKGSKHSG